MVLGTKNYKQQMESIFRLKSIFKVEIYFNSLLAFFIFLTVFTKIIFNFTKFTKGVVFQMVERKTTKKYHFP
jgi:hypothetical protein